MFGEDKYLVSRGEEKQRRKCQKLFGETNIWSVAEEKNGEGKGGQYSAKGKNCCGRTKALLKFLADPNSFIIRASH